MSRKMTTKEHMKAAVARVGMRINQVLQAAVADIGELEKALSAHTGSKSNPHGVTASQIGAAAASHTHSKSQITDFPTSMPASDVPAWAKQPSKPSYTPSEVGAAKAPLSGSVTIPASGWSSDSTEPYQWYYDIAITGVTANDRASVDIAAASLSTAAACGLCPTTETLAGKIRIRAASVPHTSIYANYWIQRGA